MREKLSWLAAITLATAPLYGVDLTTHGSVEARYLVNFGQSAGDTVLTGYPKENGLYDYASSGGNGSPWWRINDGDTVIPMNTFGGSNPDFFGYRFKQAATVNSVDYWERGYPDGGTFGATPAVQYLDAVQGNWVTITGVNWAPAYDPLYVDGEVRHYQITLTTPLAHAWGIRLLGDASETPGAGAATAANDDGDVPGAGFIGVSELKLDGSLELGTLDLHNNLALHADPISNNWQRKAPADIARVTDGLFDWEFPKDETTAGQVFQAGMILEDFVGVTWPAAKNQVAAVGMNFLGYQDGGWIGGSCNQPAAPRIEYTLDGINWFPVNNLNLGRYPEDYKTLSKSKWGPDAGFLFRFDPVNNITGIRIIGKASGGPLWEADGFIGVMEFEVFADPGS